MRNTNYTGAVLAIDCTDRATVESICWLVPSGVAYQAAYAGS